MPVFVGHPLRGFFGKTNYSFMCCLAGKDAIGIGKMIIELCFINILCFFSGINNVHAIQRKCAQPLTGMAPAVNIPVVAVIDHALWRDPAFGGLVTFPAM